MQINSIFHKIITAIAIAICASAIYSGQAIAAENASKTITASATISKPFENTAFVKAIIEASASQTTKENFVEASTKNINNIADLIIAIGKFFGSFLILIVLLLFGYILIKDIKKNTIIIEPFEMPDELTKKGYTGKSIAHQLSDKFNHIQKNAQVLSNVFIDNQQEKLQSEINLPWRQEHIEVSVSNFSIKSLKLLFYPLKRWFGYRVIYICGEVQQIANNEYKIIARCDDIEYTIEKNTRENLQQSLLPVAENLYEKIHPEILVSYLLNRNGDKDKKKAEKIIDILLLSQANKPNHKNGLLLLAYTLQEKEKYTDAIITLNKFKNIKLSNYEMIIIHSLKSECLYFQGKYEQAINELKKRITLEKHNISSGSYFNWGLVLVELNRYEEAIEKFEKAIEINPNYPKAYLNLGNCLGALNKYKEAIEKFQKAIELNSNYPMAYLNWGNNLIKLNKYEEAIEKYQKAIELSPNYAMAYLNWGTSLGQFGKYKEAIEKFEKAIEINPNYAEAYYGWGVTLVMLNKYEEAIEKFKKSIEINPNDFDAYSNWGTSLGQLNRHEEAIEKFKKATDLNPNFIDAYFNWGHACYKLKKYKEAKEKFQKVVELSTNETLSKRTKQLIKQLEEI